ncbi:hypothetical protein Tco_0472162 [Tanacetum coccineum]
MAYISNSLGSNNASKDSLNYMHHLIAHDLINGLKLDYVGIIFNDLAAKLNNSVRHPSLAYARFISLILEKALGDNYVISEEIALKIPLIACLVSEDVAGLDLCDNVYDGSPYEDTKFNEIIHFLGYEFKSSLYPVLLIELELIYQTDEDKTKASPIRTSRLVVEEIRQHAKTNLQAKRTDKHK